MCIVVHRTEKLAKKRFFWKSVKVVKQNLFESRVAPHQRQGQEGIGGETGFHRNGCGTSLQYRVGEVTIPTPGSPGIYVFATKEQAVRNAAYKTRHEGPTAAIKVMASTDQNVHYGSRDELAIVAGPVLVVKRERVSR